VRTGKVNKKNISAEESVLSHLNLETAAIIEIDLKVFDEQKMGEVIQTLEHQGYFAVRVDESAISNKNALLHALNRACGFPDYFGFNWDALFDSLVDFSWRPAKGYVLLYKNPEQLDKSDLRNFFDIVEEASIIWARSDIPFKLVIPEGAVDI